MALTYEWKITNLKVRDEGANKNAITQTQWTVTGTDENGHSGTFNGATPFSTTTMPAGDVFVPFEELTEEIVIGWIKDVVVGTYKDHVDEQIQKQIDDKYTPTTESALPWATK